MLRYKDILWIENRIIRLNKSKTARVHSKRSCHDIGSRSSPGISALNKFDEVKMDKLVQDLLKNFFMLFWERQTLHELSLCQRHKAFATHKLFCNFQKIVK